MCGGLGFGGAGGEDGLNSIRFDSLRQRIYIVGGADKIIVADARSGKELGTITVPKAATVEFNKHFLYVAYARNSRIQKLAT